MGQIPSCGLYCLNLIFTDVFAHQKVGVCNSNANSPMASFSTNALYKGAFVSRAFAHGSETFKRASSALPNWGASNRLSGLIAAATKNGEPARTYSDASGGTPRKLRRWRISSRDCERRALAKLNRFAVRCCSIGSALLAL